MTDFWNNVSRYPRFFISSLLGSILIILAPLKSLRKIPRFQAFGIIGFVLLLALLYNVLLKMTGL